MSKLLWQEKNQNVCTDRMKTGINLRIVGKKIAIGAIIFFTIPSGILTVYGRDKPDVVPEGAKSGDLMSEPIVFKTKSGHYTGLSIFCSGKLRLRERI